MTSPDPTGADRRARDAAARLHDDVLGTIDLDAAQAETLRSSRRPAVLTLTTAAVVVALVAAVLILRPGAGDVEVAIDEDGTSTSVPEVTAPDIESMPTPIALGAPDDGKESVGLPVDADPKNGLTDGQVVTVTGAQFPPNEQVGVVMCTREAGQEHGGRGVDACNIGHFRQGTTDGQGNVSVEFSVRRFASLDGEEIDCASEAGRCIIGMGLLSDYDQSGGVAVDFDADVPAPPPPTASLSRAEGLRDGETVELSVAGLVPNSSLHVQQCAGDSGACTYAQIDELVADGDGSFDGPVRVWRQFGSHDVDGQPTNIDCAVDRCRLDIFGEVPAQRALDPIALSFDPSSGGRTAPTVTLVDPGPFAVGDRFAVEVSGVRDGDYVEASICPSPERECVAFAEPTGPGDGTTRVLTIHVNATAPACETGCPLVVLVYPDDVGPPPLFPEPVLVAITG